MQGQDIAQALGVLQEGLQYVGTAAFAISGALLAGQKRMDLAGVVVLGTIVAVGGGTLRDLLLGQLPVFWVTDPTFIIVAAVTALLTPVLFRSGALKALQRFRLVQLSDAAGLALFVVVGVNVALSADADPVSAAAIGVIAGVGGGIIRDMLANRIPDVLEGGRLYATAALAGAVLYLLLLQLPVSPVITVWGPIIVIFGLRVLSVNYGWGVPKFDAEGEGDGSGTLD